MDIQKEREAFEKHASKFFTDSKEAFKTNGDQYLYDEVIWMWDCWIERAKAQAIPEGFVVVPVEPTEEMLIKGNRLALADKGYRYDAASIWETMIEAARGGNE